MRVTIIPADNAVYVDDEVLFFEFSAPANIHAIQWSGAKGIVEYANGSGTKEFSDMTEIQPYIDAFNAYKESLNNIVVE